MPKTTVKTEIVEPDNSPNVVAYRVAQLEKTVIEGFREHNKKLDSLIHTFVGRAEFQELVGIVKDRTALLQKLELTDSRQQGAIETSRRYITVGLTVLSILVAAFATYFGLRGR